MLLVKEVVPRQEEEEPGAAVTAGRALSNPARTKGKTKRFEDKKLLVSRAVSGRD